MAKRQRTHADDCWSWGPAHYECAMREIKALRAEREVIVAEAKKYAGESGRLKAKVELLTEMLKMCLEVVERPSIIEMARVALRDHDQENKA